MLIAPHLQRLGRLFYPFLGWTLTILGLLSMLIGCFVTLVAILGVLTGEVRWQWTLVAFHATVVCYLLWRLGARLGRAEHSGSHR